MQRGVHRTRTRFLVAVEGESEQSFFKWVYELSKDVAHVHLDVCLLGGGGFESMLKRAVREKHRKIGISGSFKDHFLVVDSDRAEQGDWPIEKLRQEAGNLGFTLCVQRPNFEGVLLRMFPDQRPEFTDAASAKSKLLKAWPEYKKGVDASALRSKFTLQDLKRMATGDTEFSHLLSIIGLI